MRRSGYDELSSEIHRRGYIGLKMAEGRDIPTAEQEKEPGKRTPWWKRLWARRSQKRTQPRKPWTLREFWGKTHWEWMQLLIVPVALLLITVAFTWQQNNRQEAIEEQRTQDLALQGYLDQMGALMLEDLSDPKVRTLMQARTLSMLKRLDTSRKAEVVQFLSDAGLVGSVGEEDPVIELGDANLANVDLSGARLRNADLESGNLEGADLSYANLEGANLSKADLRSAELDGADLDGANLQADLSYANLFIATLREANLEVANLNWANLKAANLTGANLQIATLYETKLSSGTNLEGANLTNAGVTYEQLTQTKALEGATMPNGQKYEEWLKDKGSRGED
jgi:uncharacterized protein YjbI with pentapeptide repeats